MPSGIDSSSLSSLATAFGSKAQTVETAAYEALNLQDDAKQSDITAAAKKLGVPDGEAQKMGIKSLHLKAQQKHADTMSMMTLLSELMKAAQQAKDRIIQNIGR